MLTTTVQLFKALADRSRLLILNALRKKPMYVEELAETIQLTPSTISFHLKKMEEVGIVTAAKDQYYTIYKLDEQLLSKTLEELIRIEQQVDTNQNEKEEAYRNKVLHTFFKYEKVVKIPVGRKKRRVILDEIAKHFEYDKKYAERDVNLIISDFHDDYCFIRRAMIEEKILARENGIYWKL